VSFGPHRIETTIGKRAEVCTLVMIAPRANEAGILSKHEGSFPNLADLVAELENGPGSIIPPNVLTLAYEGENLIAISYPEWVPETEESLKSPRQLAWEKMSEEERKGYGKRLAHIFAGLNPSRLKYDPSKLKITVGDKIIHDGSKTVVRSAGYACPKCQGPIEEGDECVFVKGVAYCPMCAGTFGPE